MNIDKAIRKQNKSLKRFLFSSCLVFLLILLILIFLPGIYTEFKIILIFLQIIILILISGRLEDKWLRYVVNENKILVKTGLINATTVIRKNKVLLVHTKDKNKDMKIIIIIESKVKKRNFIEVNKKFLSENKELYKYLQNLKEKNPSRKYFYTIIYNGGFCKYKFLNDVYINCDKAFFTDKVIENIKLYRNIE